jgi:hypothetical protein
MAGGQRAGGHKGVSFGYKAAASKLGCGLTVPGGAAIEVEQLFMH